MSKPLNQNKRNEYIVIGAAIYVFIVFFFLHFGYISETDKPSLDMLVKTFTHMNEHPFQIFPVRLKNLFMGMLAGLLAPMILYTEYLKKRDLRPSVENGSARWNTDLKKFEKKFTDMPKIGTGSPNMIMTQNVQISMDTFKTQRNNNVMCIGGAGSRKSRGLIMPNILQLNCCYVVTDPSGELLRTMSGVLTENGYEVRSFNLSNMAASGHYNPFHYLKDDKDVLSLITALFSNTTPSGSHPNDPFWENAEKSLITACCFYVIQLDRDCHTQNASFHTVLKLLHLSGAADGEVSALDELFSEYEEAHGSDIAVEYYAGFKTVAGSQTARSISICAQTRLQVWNLGAVQTLTNTDDLRLDEIGDKKVALFCVTPTEEKTFNFLVGLLYTQLFSTLYKKAENSPNGRLQMHTRFLLDEFANIGKIPDFPEKLSTMRKFEISCTIVLQALSQIKSMYKDEWEILMANCDSLLYLGTNDETTNKYISAALGKETIRAINSSVSKGRQGSYSQSFNKTGRELMTPDELKKLDNNDCIYFLRGYDPFYDRKFVLEKHPNYTKTPLAKNQIPVKGGRKK